MMGAVEVHLTPAQVADGYDGFLPDRELPGLAAKWLADGYDSPALVELAGLTRQDGLEARRLLDTVLEELGFPRWDGFAWDERPWRGRWPDIWWAVQRMDDTHSPYASAQIVVEIVGDVPGLWEPARGTELMELLARYDNDRDWRDETLDAIREHLRALREDDVPPLVARSEE
jgi:hypothetical protein